MSASDAAGEDPHLLAMARDELDRALGLSWRALSGVIPWGDSFEGVCPAGRDVQVERSYIWQTGHGGDILCEVSVAEIRPGGAPGAAVKVSAVIERQAGVAP